MNYRNFQYIRKMNTIFGISSCKSEMIVESIAGWQYALHCRCTSSAPCSSAACDEAAISTAAVCCAQSIENGLKYLELRIRLGRWSHMLHTSTWASFLAFFADFFTRLALAFSSPASIAASFNEEVSGCHSTTSISSALLCMRRPKDQGSIPKTCSSALKSQLKPMIYVHKRWYMFTTCLKKETMNNRSWWIQNIVEMDNIIYPNYKEQIAQQILYHKK